jgi:hypothetical protein
MARTVRGRRRGSAGIDERRLAQLTEAILRVQSTVGGEVVRGVVEMGRMLAAAREMLPDAAWTRWTAGLPFTARTITNYLMLARWADTRPAELARLEHLGPSKLYLLGPLDAALRRKVTGRRALAIPEPDGTVGDRKKTIDTMTVVELGRVLAGADDLATPPVDRPPIGKLVRGLSHAIAGVRADVTGLVARKREVDRDTAIDLHAELGEVLEALADAFDL